MSYPLKEANPWDSVGEKYKVNDIVNVTIKKFMPFGAFGELEDGVEGLIHISQISDGVLFMVAYASTTKVQVKEAIDELRKNSAEILGTVFTMYDKKKDSNYQSGKYYGYYSKYSE